MLITYEHQGSSLKPSMLICRAKLLFCNISGVILAKLDGQHDSELTGIVRGFTSISGPEEEA